MIDHRLLNHPKVQKEAERLAHEAYDAEKCAADGKFPDHWAYRGTWISHRIWRVPAHIHLLSDPTRPETRDWLIRCLESSPVAQNDDWNLYKDDPNIIVEKWLTVNEENAT